MEEIIEYRDVNLDINKILRYRINDYDRGVVVGFRKRDDAIIVDVSETCDREDLWDICNTLLIILQETEKSS